MPPRKDVHRIFFEYKFNSTVCRVRNLPAPPPSLTEHRPDNERNGKKNPRKRCNKETEMLREHQFGHFNTGCMVEGNSMFPLVCQRLKSHWLNYIEEVRAKRLPAHERQREKGRDFYTHCVGMESCSKGYAAFNYVPRVSAF